MFITFEGGEGTGKSVQANLLKEFFISSGVDVVLTREPGGTPFAEEIRKTLLTGEPEKITPLTEALMYLAARAEHWERKIKPALNAGKVVISDRFHDSSVVYQGICKGVDINVLDTVYSSITNNQIPDRTYLIDLAPEIGLARSLSRDNSETRFEKMDISFHKKVRDAFLELARKCSDRYLVLDGSLPIDAIQELIRKDLSDFLKLG